MSRSRPQQCSQGRGCPVCGDAGEVRRAREDDAARADEREDPDPVATMRADAAVDRADQPALISPRCDREQCSRWQPCAACHRQGFENLVACVRNTGEPDGEPGP